MQTDFANQIEFGFQPVDMAFFIRQAYADSVHDYVSRDMMIEILADEEGHIDWLETELDLIGKIGLQNYLQSQIKVSD